MGEGRQALEGKGRKEEEEGEGEAELRYETMENLAKGGYPSPLLSVVSVQSVGGLLLRLRPSSISLPLHPQPSPFPRAAKEGEGSASTRLTDEPF